MYSIRLQVQLNIWISTIYLVYGCQSTFQDVCVLASCTSCHFLNSKLYLYHVTSLLSDAPLSTWHHAAILCRDTTADLRHVCTSSSSVCRNNSSFHTWRPSVSCGCRMRLELSAVLAASSPVTDDVQAPLESRTVRVLLHLTVFT